MAIFTGLADLGMVAGGPVFGWIVERAGYFSLYAVVAASLGVGLVVFLPWNARVSGPPKRGAV